MAFQTFEIESKIENRSSKKRFLTKVPPGAGGAGGAVGRSHCETPVAAL